VDLEVVLLAPGQARPKRSPAASTAGELAMCIHTAATSPIEMLRIYDALFGGTPHPLAPANNQPLAALRGRFAVGGRIEIVRLSTPPSVAGMGGFSGGFGGRSSFGFQGGGFGGAGSAGPRPYQLAQLSALIGVPVSAA